MKSAQKQLEQMRERFIVPQVELQPHVFVKVTSNWVELSMRYVVEAKKRRIASSYLYSEIFKRVQKNAGIQIASETMDLTVHRPKAA